MFAAIVSMFQWLIVVRMSAIKQLFYAPRDGLTLI